MPLLIQLTHVPSVCVCVCVGWLKEVTATRILIQIAKSVSGVYADVILVLVDAPHAPLAVARRHSFKWGWRRRPTIWTLSCSTIDCRPRKGDSGSGIAPKQRALHSVQWARSRPPLVVSAFGKPLKLSSVLFCSVLFGSVLVSHFSFLVSGFWFLTAVCRHTAKWMFVSSYVDTHFSANFLFILYKAMPTNSNQSKEHLY